MKPILECFNHYPAPISFEQNTLIPLLNKVVQKLNDDALILAGSPLSHLETVEFNLIDDSVISKIHQDFMEDSSTTDVITFQHGEIFISYDTALVESSSRKIPLKEELFRYHVHGLLHLAGYDDQSPEDYKLMHELQESLVCSLLV